MDATLVSKRASAHVRLLVSQWQVCEFRNKLGNGRKMREPFQPDSGMPQLQFEIWQYGTQVRIPTALAIAVQATLYVRDSGFNRHDCVGYSHFGIIVAMDPKYSVKTRSNI